MRKLETLSSRLAVISKEANRYRVHRAYLAEDYDGIGQYILITLSGGSTSGALKARIASADFGTGQVIPNKTPVSVFINHGRIEIMSMGSK